MSKPQEFTPYTKADADLARTKYNTKKYNKLKKGPKIEEKSKFSTLQEAVDKNLASFEKQKLKNPKKAADIEQQQIDYILDTMPFIRDHGKVTEEEENEDAKTMFSVKSSTENNKNFQKYLYTVEKVVNNETAASVTEIETTDQIYTCKCGGSLCTIVNSTQSDLVCTDCGVTQPVIDSYSFQDQNESMAYKRSNHLSECIQALQGKEGTTVPDEVIEAVRAEFKKHRITSTADITPAKTKQFLKKLGYSAYYENIYSIANAISGAPTLKLSLELEKKFRDMFSAIQDPFERHKPAARKNFLSYSYVLYKFSELLGHDELLPYFSLLKCRQNLHAQDRLWKSICEDLSWEYLPTI